MKVIKFIGKVLAIVLVSVVIIYCTGDKKEQQVQTPQPKDSTVQSIEAFDIRFGELWPFNPDNIRFEISDDRRILTINGQCNDTFGITCWEKKVSLKGNRTLEIEVLDLGNSAFFSGETQTGKGDGKMLKVFIRDATGGADISLVCKDDMSRSNDPEFVLRGTGKFQYSLKDFIKDDAVYKLGLTFYNARLEGFKLSARFVE